MSSGDDTVTFADGDGPAITADSFGATIAAGDTITFGGGVDTVVGFLRVLAVTCWICQSLDYR